MRIPFIPSKKLLNGRTFFPDNPSVVKILGLKKMNIVLTETNTSVGAERGRERGPVILNVLNTRPIPIRSPFTPFHFVSHHRPAHPRRQFNEINGPKYPLLISILTRTCGFFIFRNFFLLF